MKKTKIAQLLQPQMTTRTKASSSGDSTSEEEDSTHAAYHNLQACLSGIGGERSPTEQEVQDCVESSYGEMDSSDSTPNETTDDVDEDVEEEE
jgi:hypothetical protein